MDKSIYIILSTLAVVSCSKEVDDAQGISTETKEIYLSASMQNTSGASDEATKTYLSGSSVLWSEADAIRVFSSDGEAATFTLSEGAGTDKARFKGSISDTATPYIGFYPADNAVSRDDSKIGFKAPQCQNGKAGNIADGQNPAIAMFPDATSEATFYNMFSFVRFTLKGESDLDCLRLVSLKDDDILWGDAVATINTADEPSEWALTVSGGTNTLNLNFSEGLQLTETGVDVYFAIPPKTLTKGFKLIAYSKGEPIDEFCSVASNEFLRSHVKPIKPVTVGLYKVLDAIESANCYQVMKTDTMAFKFCAEKGNSSEVVPFDEAASLWQTKNNTESGNVISNVRCSLNCISFKLTGNSGNALIAAKNSGTITWSWNIWVTESEAENAAMSNKVKVMDRDLGSVNSTVDDVNSMGLLYQWGRKDPFPGFYKIKETTLMAVSPAGAITNEAKSDANSNWAIQHPTVFVDNNSTRWDQSGTSIWSENKTVYDPCPAGYRVPTSAEMTGLSFGEWDNTNYRYQEQACGYYFHATGRVYYSSKGVHTNETPITGYFWTCTHGSGNLAKQITVSSSKAASASDINKSFGLAVRCVVDGKSPLNAK